jgi:hypothetical protein
MGLTVALTVLYCGVQQASRQVSGLIHPPFAPWIKPLLAGLNIYSDCENEGIKNSDGEFSQLTSTSFTYIHGSGLE